MNIFGRIFLFFFNFFEDLAYFVRSKKTKWKAIDVHIDSVDIVDLPENFPENPFSIGRHLVDQELYSSVMESNPSLNQGNPKLPVDSVQFHEMCEFCNRVSIASGLKPFYDVRSPDSVYVLNTNGWRLPTINEWIFSAGNPPQDKEDVDNTAWHWSNSPGKTSQEIGTKIPNNHGLFDMWGNLWELAEFPFFQKEKPTRKRAKYRNGVPMFVLGSSFKNDARVITTGMRRDKIWLDQKNRENYIKMREKIEQENVEQMSDVFFKMKLDEMRIHFETDDNIAFRVCRTL